MSNIFYKKPLYYHEGSCSILLRCTHAQLKTVAPHLLCRIMPAVHVHFGLLASTFQLFRLQTWKQLTPLFLLVPKVKLLKQKNKERIKRIPRNRLIVSGDKNSKKCISKNCFPRNEWLWWFVTKQSRPDH